MTRLLGNRSTGVWTTFRDLSLVVNCQELDSSPGHTFNWFSEKKLLGNMNAFLVSEETLICYLSKDWSGDGHSCWPLRVPHQLLVLSRRLFSHRQLIQLTSPAPEILMVKSLVRWPSEHDVRQLQPPAPVRGTAGAIAWSMVLSCPWRQPRHTVASKAWKKRSKSHRVVRFQTSINSGVL